MSTSITIARYHLVQRLLYVWAPWGVMSLAFVVNLLIHASTANEPDPNYTGAVAIIFIATFFGGVISAARSLPFGLSLGVSRRTYYAGTALFAAGLAVADGFLLAMLQVIERASGGWGIHMAFFRTRHILPGPWSLTWLTSFVLLVALFAYGMAYGLLALRWPRFGVGVFIVAQVIVIAPALLIINSISGSHDPAHALERLSAAGLTGVFAAAAAVLLAGGFAVIRGLTV